MSVRVRRRRPRRTPRSWTRSIDRPAAARWPPKRSRCAEQAASAPWRSKLAIERPDPFHESCEPRDEHDRAMEALDEPRGDDPDHALVPVLVPEDVAAAAPLAAPAARRRPRPPRAGSAPRRPAARDSAPRARRRAPAPRRRPSVSTSSSATSGRPSRPAALIRGASRKPTDAGVDGCRIDAARSACSACSPGRRVHASARSPAAASARFSSTSGTTSAMVASATRSRLPPNSRVLGAEERLAELVDDARSAQLGERIRATAASRRSGSREATSPGRWWSVTTTSRPRAFASATSSTAVIPQSTVSTSPTPSSASRLERVARDAVALLEPARQVPVDVGAELAQEQDGERGRADAVDVVVAVDADARAARRPPRGSARRPRAMSPSRNGSCPGSSASRNRRAVVGLAVAAAHEHRRRDLAHAELARERARRRARRAGAIVHELVTSDDGTDASRTPSDERSAARSRRRRSESSDDLHPEEDDPDVAPTTTTAIGV